AVGRGSGDDHQVNVVGLKTGGIQRTTARLGSQFAGDHALFGQMTRADSGALDDPLVRGFYAPLDQILVGDRLARHETARSGNARKSHTWFTPSTAAMRSL